MVSFNIVLVHRKCRCFMFVSGKRDPIDDRSLVPSSHPWRNIFIYEIKKQLKAISQLPVKIEIQIFDEKCQRPWKCRNKVSSRTSM